MLCLQVSNYVAKRWVGISFEANMLTNSSGLCPLEQHALSSIFKKYAPNTQEPLSRKAQHMVPVVHAFYDAG